MSLHENTATTLETPDESAVVDLVDGETTKYIGEAMREGTYALFRFEVTCEPQDLEISFRLADDGDDDDDALERATTTMRRMARGRRCRPRTGGNCGSWCISA